MDSGKLPNWLSIAGNIGLLAGLILVAVQIAQNNRLAEADMVSRHFEYSMQYSLAMIGENPSEVWSKAAIDPNSLSDEEIARVQFMVDYWWNSHNRMAYLDEEGLADENWKDALNYHSVHTYGGDRVAASIWKYWANSENPGREFDWTDRVAERLPEDPIGNAQLLRAVRRSLEANKDEF